MDNDARQLSTRAAWGGAFLLFVYGCCASAATVISDVTVISPERAEPLEHAYVGIENGRITAVSTQHLKADQKGDLRLTVTGNS